jgi:hypothetical protein
MLMRTDLLAIDPDNRPNRAYRMRLPRDYSFRARGELI